MHYIFYIYVYIICMLSCTALVSTSDIFFTPGFRKNETYLGHSILVAESKGLSKGSQNLTMALTFPTQL